MMTSEPLLPLDLPTTESQLTLFAEDSLAKTSPPLAGKTGLPPIVQDYGAKCKDLLANLDPATSSWKTSQISLLANGEVGLQPFSETWPRSGMMRSGTAYQLPTLARPTYGTEFGSFRLQTFRKTVSVPSEGFSRDVPCQEEMALANGERPCPLFREWAMQYPENWTALLPSETPSSRKSRK